MTSVANTVAMTTLAVHTLQPLIFYSNSMPTAYCGTGTVWYLIAGPPGKALTTQALDDCRRSLFHRCALPA